MPKDRKILPLICIVLFCFQKLKLDFLDSVNSKSDEYFNKVLQASIHERLEVEKSDAKKPGDFLQGLVSAHLASGTEK